MTRLLALVGSISSTSNVSATLSMLYKIKEIINFSSIICLQVSKCSPIKTEADYKSHIKILLDKRSPI